MLLCIMLTIVVILFVDKSRGVRRGNFSKSQQETILNDLASRSGGISISAADRAKILSGLSKQGSARTFTPEEQQMIIDNLRNGQNK